MWCAGIDEAGRGSCLGPLIVGICAIPEQDIPLLDERGVDDSKRISAERRAELYHWLKNEGKERGWAVESMAASALHIDDWMSHSSLNDLEIEMFAQLGNHHLEVLRGEGGDLIVDACDTDAARFGNKVASRLTGWPWKECRLVSEHGADARHLVVGAASIIAKHERDLAVAHLSREYDIELGSGYPSDARTISSLPLLMQGAEPDATLRWSWATIKSAWQVNRGGRCPVRTAAEPLFNRSTIFDF